MAQMCRPKLAPESFYGHLTPALKAHLTAQFFFPAQIASTAILETNVGTAMMMGTRALSLVRIPF